MLTFCLEFIPYLGGAAMIILLSLVGLATFDSVGHAFLPPLVYLAITTLQNNLVSPIAYGRRLRLNPVAVLVGVLFWYALWGDRRCLSGGPDPRQPQDHRRSHRLDVAGRGIPRRVRRGCRAGV